MAILILHLGSNLGNRQEKLNEAINFINKEVGFVFSQSSIYETAVWLGDEQDKMPEILRKQAPFLNMALQVETLLEPINALQLCLGIEDKLGRVRKQKWGPRRIDIDLIFYDDKIINTPKLIVPHPWMQYRRFVLMPLAEIIPEWVHPVLKQNVQDLLGTCEDEGVVRVLGC